MPPSAQRYVTTVHNLFARGITGKNGSPIPFLISENSENRFQKSPVKPVVVVALAPDVILAQRPDPGLICCIVRGCGQEDGDASHLIRLLRTRPERPRNCSATD